MREATANRQQPWTENGLAGDDFCFKDCSAASTVVDCAQPPPPASTYFAHSEAGIDESALQTLSAFNRRLLDSGCKLKLITIRAYSDPDSGQRDAGLGLAQQRAEAIRGWLVQAGQPADRIEAKGFVAEGTSGGVRVQSVVRRAEIYVMYDVGLPEPIDTLKLILERGMILNTAPSGDVGRRRLDMKFTPDGKFMTPPGIGGTWRADGDRLCITVPDYIQDKCYAYPAGKKSGDRFTLVDGADVTIK